MNKKVNCGAVTSLARLANALEQGSSPYADEILSYVGLKNGRKVTKAHRTRLHRAVDALVALRGLIHKGMMEEVVSESGERAYRVTPKGRAAWALMNANKKAA